MSNLDPPPPKRPTPLHSEAVCLEVAALRAMLGLPPKERGPDERTAPEPMQPDKPIPPDHDTSNLP